jgi:hypothetical protein
MLKEHTAVWIWDTGWWPAHVVNPALDLESNTMLVRFENGVTAPVKASEVLQRDSRPKHLPTAIWQSSRSSSA